MPQPIEGHIVPGVKDPFVVLKWNTNTRMGPPIKQKAPAPAAEQKPRDLGEERHHSLLNAISKMQVTQKVNQDAPIQQALEEQRPWR